MTDEDLARDILLELYPRGRWKEGAHDTGIEVKTFQRIVGHKGAIKSGNWAKLHSHVPFEIRWQKAKQGQEPQFDRKTKEAFGRLAIALGPRNLSAMVATMETLSDRIGADRALDVLGHLESIALEMADSERESVPGQKTSR